MACLAMYIDRLLQYHDHILLHLDKALASPHLQEDWSNIFALDVGPISLDILFQSDQVVLSCRTIVYGRPHLAHRGHIVFTTWMF
jgi:hypothetical protein